MIEIHIPVAPVPWTAPHKQKRSFVDPRASEKMIAQLHIQQQYHAVPLDEYVELRFRFVFSPPKSASKKKREEMLAGKIIPTKCDCTNLQKLYEDCLKRIVITDDRIVAKIYSEKLYGEKEGVTIQILPLKNDEKKI